MSIQKLSENTNVSAIKPAKHQIGQCKSMTVKDTVSFSGRATEAVSGATGRIKTLVRTVRQIPEIWAESEVRNSGSTGHVILDSLVRSFILLSKPVKETGIKLKIRRGKGAVEEAKLVDRKFLGNRFYTIEQEGKEPIAYVQFIDKENLLNKDGAACIGYINTMHGREQYVGLEQTLLRAVAEDMINQGRLPYINGNTVGEGAPARTIVSEHFHRHIGAEPVKGLGMKGLPKVGVASEEQARGIIQKMLTKGHFLFPETEQNAKKLLARGEIRPLGLRDMFIP